MKEHRFERAVIKIDKLEAVLVSDKHPKYKIYKCPYCLDREIANKVLDPKPDNHGKLYAYKDRSSAICFRCNTVIIVGWTADDAIDKLAEAFKSEQEEILVENLPEINLDSYECASKIPEAMAYLKSRHKGFNESNVSRLGLKWFCKDSKVKTLEGWVDFTKKGIICPFKADGIIKSFQIRFLNMDKKSRFYTMDGVKLIYSITKIPIDSEISICEGVYDAIALFMMGFPNPVAILGSTFSQFQADQLRSVLPTRVNLCMDSIALNKELAKDIRRKLPSVTDKNFYNFKNQDPEEYMKANPRYRYQEWKGKPYQFR